MATIKEHLKAQQDLNKIYKEIIESERKTNKMLMDFIKGKNMTMEFIDYAAKELKNG